MRTLADQTQVGHLIHNLANAIRAEMNGGDWALVGIKSRGDVLAQRIAQVIGDKELEGRVGSLDITLYRDDLSEIGAAATVRTSDIPFAVDGLNVVLVDDVLMTGRSIRAAMQSLLDIGRPRRVWLSVLVDRGGRELPLQPDHVALDVAHEEVSADEMVEVLIEPTDDRDAIVVHARSKGAAPA